MASRGSSHKRNQCQRAHSTLRLRSLSTVIASSLKIAKGHHLIWPSHSFTPSQGFWVLLSCHCHRQDLLWYLTEISRTHLLIPDAGCRYEVVCVYLATLMRLEISETETREGDTRQRAVYISPNPQHCPYCNTRYKSYVSVANAATAIWQHCQSCALETLKVKDAGPLMPAFTMKMRESISKDDSNRRIGL